MFTINSMSRTFRKGGKGPGEEYWSKRPGNKKTREPGKFAKKINNSLERLEGKKEARYCQFCGFDVGHCACNPENW